jgi:hypothetical protein
MPPKGISRGKTYNLTTFQGGLGPKIEELVFYSSAGKAEP